MSGGSSRYRTKLLTQTFPALFICHWLSPPSIRLHRPTFDVKAFKQMRFSSHLKSVYIYTLSHRLAKLVFFDKLYLCQRSTEPNKPPRRAELFWALLPQLFAQFLAHSSAEEFELLNTQSETAGKANTQTTDRN